MTAQDTQEPQAAASADVRPTGDAAAAAPRDPGLPPAPAAAAVTGVSSDGGIQLAHACEIEPEPPSKRPRGSRTRVTGLDLARALAVLGMMIIHITPMVDEDGLKPLAWVITSGNSAALFAVLAGVGVGLTTGRHEPPRGRRWVGAALNLVVRTLFIGSLGLLLGFFVPADSSAEVILPTYAVLFVMLIPFLRASARFDIAFGLGAAIVTPLISHVIRATWQLPGWDQVQGNIPNLTLLDPLIDPVGTLTQLLLTGTFPALTWFAYACVGLGVGRTMIWNRHVAAKLLAGGVALAALAAAAGWFLMDVVGGRVQLAAVASRSMSLEAFTELLVWGAGGTLPTTSWWWNAVLAPHTGTPLDLLFTIGVACAALGACLIIGRTISTPIQPLVTLGSMPLTAYVGHLIMLNIPVLKHDSWTTLLIQFVVLLVFANLWRVWFSKGPLEAVLGLFTGAVKNWTQPPHTPARALP